MIRKFGVYLTSTRELSNLKTPAEILNSQKLGNRDSEFRDFAQDLEIRQQGRAEFSKLMTRNTASRMQNVNLNVADQRTSSSH